MSQHHQNADLRDLYVSRIERRIESGLGLLLALGIGTGLAVVLVAWWSS